MRDLATSVARTVLPAVWGAVAAWLVSVGVLPADASEGVQAGLVAATTPVLIGVVYAGLRWVEPMLPAWLRRIVLGSPKAPTYK